MENQINVGDQNDQQIGQNPTSQPLANATPEGSKIKHIAFRVVILFGFAVFGFGVYYFGTQSSKNTAKQGQNQVFPSPTAFENDVTAGWKMYNFIDNSMMFKHPEDWQAEREGVFGSRTITEFKYNNTSLFELTVQGNYNQTTGKPYGNLDEFLGPGLNKSRDALVGDQPAKRIEDQGDPGHVVPYEEVVVFAPDNKSIVSLYYQSSYYTKPNANNVLDQIVSTFKFLGQNESAQQKSGFIQGTVQSEAETYVVGENNISPVANFQLEIFDINNKLVHTTFTDKGGKFTAQLPPGDYYFAYKFCPQFTDSQRVEFNIKPDQVNQKTFTLHFGPC